MCIEKSKREYGITPVDAPLEDHLRRSKMSREFKNLSSSDLLTKGAHLIMRKS